MCLLNALRLAALPEPRQNTGEVRGGNGWVGARGKQAGGGETTAATGPRGGSSQSTCTTEGPILTGG